MSGRRDVDYQARRRAPLTAGELRALYEASPTSQARDLIWEIRRLHAIQWEMFRVLEECIEAPSRGRNAAHYLLERIGQIEPGVLLALDNDWDARGTPSSRYYEIRAQPGARPCYVPPREPSAPPAVASDATQGAATASHRAA